MRSAHPDLATAARRVGPLVSLYRWNRDAVMTRFHAFVVDRRNRRRYGAAAPRFAEQLWIDPLQVDHYLRGWRGFGQVVEGPWPSANEFSIQDDPVLQAAVARWVDGRAWEDTGEIERMERAIAAKGMVKGCRTRDDILRRCAQLDAIFEIVRRERRLRPQSEVQPGTFRAYGGIGMHLGQDGTLIRATNGRHRFAMARILRLPVIPVRLALVHHSALDALAQLRRMTEEPRGDM